MYQRYVKHFSKLLRCSAFLLQRHYLNIDVLKTRSEELGGCVGRIIPFAFVYRRKELSFGRKRRLAREGGKGAGGERVPG